MLTTLVVFPLNALFPMRPPLDVQSSATVTVDVPAVKVAPVAIVRFAAASISRLPVSNVPAATIRLSDQEPSSSVTVPVESSTTVSNILPLAPFVQSYVPASVPVMTNVEFAREPKSLVPVLKLSAYTREFVWFILPPVFMNSKPPNSARWPFRSRRLPELTVKASNSASPLSWTVYAFDPPLEVSTSKVKFTHFRYIVGVDELTPHFQSFPMICTGYSWDAA